MSSSSARRAAAGTGEVTRRSTARSLRRARRPARSAAEPSRPVLPFLSSSSSVVTRARPAPAILVREPGRRGAVPGTERGPAALGPRRGPCAALRLAGARAPAGPPWPPGAGKRVEPTRLHQRQHFFPGHGFFRALRLGHGACEARFAAGRPSRLAGRWARRPWARAGPILGSARAAFPRCRASPPGRREPPRRRRRGADPRRHGAGSRRRHVVISFQRLEASRSRTGRGRRRDEG